MHHKHHMHSLCQQYMHQPVMLQTQDHQVYQGMIAGVDNDNVYLMVPTDATDNSMYMRNDHANQTRQFGYGGFGYNPYYSYNPYYYPYYPYPRPGFQRLILPLAALTAISLLPYY